MNALPDARREGPVVVSIDDSRWRPRVRRWLSPTASETLPRGRASACSSRRSGLESVLLNELLRRPVGERFTRIHVEPARRHLDGSRRARPARDGASASASRRGASGLRGKSILRVGDRAHAPAFRASPIEGRPAPSGTGVAARPPFAGRLLALPRGSRDFLLAAVGTRAPDHLQCTGGSVGVRARLSDLRQRSEQHRRARRRSRIRFTHPLLAAGAYETGDPLRRAARSMCGSRSLLEDPEARAWQLAASVDDPTRRWQPPSRRSRRMPGGVGALTRRAPPRLRGAADTPAGRDDAVRRAVEAAYLHFGPATLRRAGQAPRPRCATPARASPRTSPRGSRAHSATTNALAKHTLFLQVLDEAEGDRHLRAVAHEGVAACSVWGFERFDEALQHHRNSSGARRGGRRRCACRQTCSCRGLRPRRCSAPADSGRDSRACAGSAALCGRPPSHG